MTSARKARDRPDTRSNICTNTHNGQLGELVSDFLAQLHLSDEVTGPWDGCADEVTGPWRVWMWSHARGDEYDS